MVVAVVALSIALVCALVVLGVLARSGVARDSAARARRQPHGSTVDVPQPWRTQPPPQPGADRVWEAILEPTDTGGLHRVLVRPCPAEWGVPAGRRLPAGAPLARTVQTLLARDGMNGGGSPVAVASAAVFFRFEAGPAMLDGLARGLYEVMPAADGGFRSAVRDVAGKEIVGQGRYVQTAGVRVGVRATAERAPRLALQLGVAALTVGLEIAAEADQRRRLEAIRTIATAAREEQIREQFAALEGAGRRLDLAARSVLDTGFVPTALGIDSAAGVVSTAWERSARTFEEWRDGLAMLPQRIDLDRLETALPGVSTLDGGEFWRELALYRGSLALHTRATLLAAAQAAAHDPDDPCAAFRAGLELQLGELDAAGERLREFARELADREITLGGPMVRSGTANQVTRLTRRLIRLAEELAHPQPVQDLPVAIGPGGGLELEGVVHADGSVTLLGPDAGAPEQADGDRRA